METIYCKLLKTAPEDTESYFLEYPPPVDRGVANPGNSPRWRELHGFTRYLVLSSEPPPDLSLFRKKYRESDTDQIVQFWEKSPVPETPEVTPRKRRVSKLHLQTYLSQFIREVDGVEGSAWTTLKHLLSQNVDAADAYAAALFLEEGHPILEQMLEAIAPLIEAFGIDIEHLLTVCDDPGLDVLASYTKDPTVSETEVAE